MSENQTLDDLVKEIKRSPLFYLFSASKEEFHSNFWKWLSTLKDGDKNKIEETIKLFLNENLDNIDFDKSELEREKKLPGNKNEKPVILDLALVNNGVFNVVIENKIKDFANQFQLENIQNKFKNHEPKPIFILTTLFNYDGLKFPNWNIVTYKDIADKLDAKNFIKSGFFHELIYNYKKFLMDLSQLASSEELNLTDEYNFFSACKPEIFSLLNDVKLAEAYKKFRASHMAKFFNGPNKLGFNPTWGINNKRVTLDIFFKEFLPEKIRVGIQIEENQYRIYVYGDKKIVEKKLEVIFSKFVGLVEKYNGNKDYCTYDYPKLKKIFKYRYKIIEQPKNYEDLLKELRDDIGIINNLNLIHP